MNLIKMPVLIEEVVGLRMLKVLVSFLNRKPAQI